MTEFIVLAVIGFIFLLPLIWGIATYNRFVRVNQHLKESWSNIDIELKRRYELIPNLVETAKGYAQHEREVMERIVELRNRAVQSTGDAASQANDESALMLGLKELFVVAENYPELKADQHFLKLQHELSMTEDRIAASRRFFNGNVREFNDLCQMFPTSIIASMCGHKTQTYFELDRAAERVVPKVALG